MKDHGKCCQVTKFPYPEPIFNECLMEAIGDLYETPTDFWRPGVAGPKFNMSTNRVEATVVEFDSNIKFSFSHNAMNQFYQQVETWFSKVIGRSSFSSIITFQSACMVAKEATRWTKQSSCNDDVNHACWPSICLYADIRHKGLTNTCHNH